MAVCLRCLDAVQFLVLHGADPTLTTPIKIYREKRNDSVFGKLKNLKDRLLYVEGRQTGDSTGACTHARTPITHGSPNRTAPHNHSLWLVGWLVG